MPRVATPRVFLRVNLKRKQEREPFKNLDSFWGRRSCSFCNVRGCAPWVASVVGLKKKYVASLESTNNIVKTETLGRCHWTLSKVFFLI